MQGEDAAVEFSFVALTIGVFGGLALFLFGMERLTDALKSLAGGGLRETLSRLTKNRFSAAMTGGFVTAIIQSSSVTTVLVVGFVSAGLMTLQQAIGIILGANVGTTITAQIIAFKVTSAALVFIAVGFGMEFLLRSDRFRRLGAGLMGLGLVFLGMTIMGEATAPLRTYGPFTNAMASMGNPFLGILAGAVFTAIVQSSSATTGVVIVLAGQGFISLEAGIALVLGANVGTCVTALIAAIGKPRVAVQAALAHVIANLVGAAVWLPLIGVLATAVRAASPSHAELGGIAQLAAETPRQIANAHTIFNIANTFLLIWFVGPIAWLVSRLAPSTPERKSRATPKFLDDALVATPALAIDRLRLETARLCEVVQDSVRALAGASTAAERDRKMQRMREHADDAHSLQDAILAYARRTLENDPAEAEIARIQRMVAVAQQLGSITETIRIKIPAITSEWRAKGLRASDETRQMADNLTHIVSDALHQCVLVILQDNAALARDVVARKREVTTAADQLQRRITDRFVTDEPNRVILFRLESEIIEVLKRIYYFAKRIAKYYVDIEEPPDAPPAPGDS